MIGIYKITSPSGRVYIGQSWDIEKRFRSYRTSSGTKTQRYIYNSLMKYGVNNHRFEIISHLPEDISQQVLDEYEIVYFEFYRDSGTSMMNIKYPGRGGKHSLESRNLMSLGQRKAYKTNPSRYDNVKKKIYQYTLQGEFVREWGSTAECSVALKISGYSISDSIRSNKSYCGFLFSSSKEFRIIPNRRLYKVKEEWFKIDNN